MSHFELLTQSQSKQRLAAQHVHFIEPHKVHYVLQHRVGLEANTKSDPKIFHGIV